MRTISVSKKSEGRWYQLMMVERGDSCHPGDSVFNFELSPDEFSALKKQVEEAAR